MKNKTKSMIILGSLLLIIIVIFLIYQGGKSVNVTLKQMEEESPVIVRGKLIKQAEKIDSKELEEGVLEAIRVVDFYVEKVYKNDSAESIEEKSQINISETTKNIPTTEDTYYVEGYSSMELNKEYILFLKYDTETASYSSDLYGKIPVDEKEILLSDNEKNPNKEVEQEEEILSKIAKEARNKYK